jgi:outer membrane protein assembly factor BamB
MTNRTFGLQGVLFCQFVMSFFMCSAIADQWPQWRGPGRDGVWNEKGIIQKFDKPRLEVKWQAKISNGYSGPTVADSRVYITDRITKPSQMERVHCFDAITGNQIWLRSYECKYTSIGYPDGPRGSVTIDSKRAYSLGTMGHLFCFDAATGDIIWKKDLNEEYKIKMPTWGIATSPLIEDDLVIVQIGGKDACLVAFDKATGVEKWKALGDQTAYCSPIIIEQGGRRVLISWLFKRVVGLDPLSGNIYWEYPFGAEMGIASPIVQDDYLFLSSFFDGCVLLKLKQDQPGAELVWKRAGENEKKTDGLHCCISTPLMQGNYIYGVDSYGELRCLDRQNGDRIWESLEAVPKERWANIHMVKNDDKIWMFNEKGELIISMLSPEGFKEISRTKIIDPTEGQLDSRGGVCWSHPAFAYKHIYARNDNELICVNLAIPQERSTSRN